MATKKPSSKPTGPGSLSNLGRATAPMPIEKNTESAWQMFKDLQEAHNAPPGQAPKAPEPGYEATERMELQKDAPVAKPASSGDFVSLEQVLMLARRNNRACPQPAPWAAFYELLPPHEVEGRSVKAPSPADRRNWAATSSMQKRLRLRDQIEWAERTGVLQAAHDFLAALPEKHWHHFE